jgi:hypothetical protein
MTEVRDDTPARRSTWRAWLRRIVMLALAVFTGVTTMQTVLKPPKNIVEGGAAMFGYLVMGAIVAALARSEAVSRCQPRRSWTMFSLLLPFVAPFALLFMRTPRVAGIAAPELVDEFGAMYDELVRAESRRRRAEHLPLSGMVIAEVAVAGARAFVMSKHRLSPDEGEQVAALFARARR